ncbi:sulfotransferase [Pseudonocardia endophytica]|uniref:Sulfotransferase family protein n=1 Tax=Pseudonocardia endophytica TaxID=401976 RepID=A0A4R1I1T3_PSEEN|nr:sulfotransferase [Pseudonocardia endophytica]TCK27883.1 sulfotransferase family protein [Pseudonocardia endophytica]
MPGSTTDRPKVLYIAGWGRSGTTLLDNLVGSHHGVFTAGEVTCLWKLSFVDGRLCGCGVPLLNCDLWRAILDRAFGGPPDPYHMLELQRTAISVWRTPTMVSGARRGEIDAGVVEYADVLSRLYRAIAAETGASVIVDASKRPPDAVATGLAEGVDPYLLHMIRDPRACAFSWQRTMAQPDTSSPSLMHRHGRLMNIGHWVSWNLASEMVSRVYPEGHYTQLRYEDFMTDPRATMDRVMEFVGEPVVDSPFVDRTTALLPANHTVAGNPKRFRTGEVRIRLDDEWRHRQSAVDRRTATALALPLLPRYGYSAGVDERPLVTS